MEPFVLVGAGGALGAVGRYSVGLVLRAYPSPHATAAVNVVGSFVLGLVVFGGASDRLVLFLGVGVCGGFTTFSSFGFQTLDLWRRGDPRAALVNALGSLGSATGAVALAWLLV